MSVMARAQRAPVRSPDLERLTAVARQFIARSEGVLLLAQAFWLFTSAYTDHLIPPGNRILIGIGLLHLIGAGLALRYGGPFTRGGGWKVLWIGAALLMAPLMAVLLPYGEYGASPSCVQMCGYPVPPIVLLAFYPWVSAGARLMRPSLEILIIGAFVLVPLVLIGLTHDYVTRDNYASWIISSSLLVLAFLAGRTIGRLCQTAAAAQLEAGLRAERASTDRAYNTLHDEIEHALASAEVHHEHGSPERLRLSLRRIKEIIVRERTRSLLVIKEQVSVATLVTLHVRLITGVIPTVHVGEIGHLSVRSETAELLNSALSALLKNVVRHSGAQTVWVEVSAGTEFLRLDVRDDGCGFRLEVVEDSSASIHGLRDRIRQYGGDLIAVPIDQGSLVQVWLPFDPPDAGGDA